jgi:hypothetical protein
MTAEASVTPMTTPDSRRQWARLRLTTSGHAVISLDRVRTIADVKAIIGLRFLTSAA